MVGIRDAFGEVGDLESLKKRYKLTAQDIARCGKKSNFSQVKKETRRMSLIDKSLVILDYEAENKDEVLHALADLAESAGRLNDKALYIEELYHREAEAPTNVGFFHRDPAWKNGCG